MQVISQAMAENHVCMNSRISTNEGEIICAKCGIVLMSDPRPEVTDKVAAELSNDGHYVGNGLLNSQTEQADYVSDANRGVAFTLSGTKGKDYAGQKVKRQIQGDGYQVGNIIEKGMVMKEDSLTGESRLKFSYYEKPYLHILKERANTELTRYGLDTADKSIVEIFLKQVMSRLACGPIVDFCWMAAALNSGQLKPPQAAEIEKRMYDVIGEIRGKLLSRCDTNLLRKMNGEEEGAKRQEEIRIS